MDVLDGKVGRAALASQLASRDNEYCGCPALHADCDRRTDVPIGARWCRHVQVIMGAHSVWIDVDGVPRESAYELTRVGLIALHGQSAWAAGGLAGSSGGGQRCDFGDRHHGRIWRLHPGHRGRKDRSLSHHGDRHLDPRRRHRTGLDERDQEDHMGVIIGVDPHKGSHTAVAIGGDETPLAKVKVRATRRQVDQLLGPLLRRG